MWPKVVLIGMFIASGMALLYGGHMEAAVWCAFPVIWLLYDFID